MDLFDYNAEQAVLGAVLINNDNIESLLDKINIECFLDDRNKSIYNSMVQLYIEDSVIDVVTLTSKVKELGHKIQSDYISDISEAIINLKNFDKYINIIYDLHLKRELNDQCRLIQENIESGDVMDLVYNFQDHMLKKMDIDKHTDIINIKDVIHDYMGDLGRIDGEAIQTGFRDLNNLIGGFNKGDVVILAARPGLGKCLGIDTKIVMYDGDLKKVQDIKAGDLLMGPDSKPRTVLSTTSGYDKMYTVKQKRGMNYRVNESHILSLKLTGTDRVTNISIKDYLEKSERFKIRNKGYMVGVDFGQSNELEIDPYFLGVWLGDGASKNQTIHNPDHEIINYIKGYSERLGLSFSQTMGTSGCPINRVVRKNGRQINSLLVMLREMNLTGNKHIPKKYLTASREDRLSLLAGLLDTDGYKASNNVYEIAQVRKNLAEEIKFLANSLGYRVSFAIKVVNGKNYYRLNISGTVYELPMLVERKKSVNRNNRDVRNTRVEVEYDKVDKYYGFELDGDGLFLLEDFTVTHNTAIALNLSIDLTRFGHNSLLFSLEQPKKEMILRMLSIESLTDYARLKRNDLFEYESKRLNKAAKWFSGKDIYIDDTSSISIAKLKAKIRKKMLKHSIDVIIIDYLQLMSTDKRKGRFEAIGDIARELKNIAKEFNVVVIALSQLNREIEKRGKDAKPLLSDLKESGDIEQVADYIFFIDRDFYDPDSNKCDLILAKNRHGPQGTIKLIFKRDCFRFFNSYGGCR